MAELNNKKIRDLRLNSLLKNGEFISVKRLSEDLGISHRVVSRMENDREYNPGVLNMLKIADYFNVMIDDLLIKD